MAFKKSNAIRRDTLTHLPSFMKFYLNPFLLIAEKNIKQKFQMIGRGDHKKKKSASNVKSLQIHEDSHADELPPHIAESTAEEMHWIGNDIDFASGQQIGDADKGVHELEKIWISSVSRVGK